MSLIEVLVALFVLMVVLVPAATFLATGITTANVSKAHVVASDIATANLECLQASHLSQVEGQMEVGYNTPSSTTGSGYQSPGVVATGTASTNQAPCTLLGQTSSQYHQSGSSQTLWGSAATNPTPSDQCVTTGPGIPHILTPAYCTQEIDKVTQGQVSYTTTQTMQYVVSSNAGMVSPEANSCYGGIDNSSPVTLEATDTVSWPQNGSTSATTQSRTFTPTQIDIQVMSSATTPPSPYTGAGVTISGPVTMPPTGTTVTTGKNGCASFVGVPQGTYTVTATDSSGNTLVTQQVTVTPGSIYPLVMLTTIQPPPYTGPNAPPYVSGINPTEGPVTGGNTVYICGSNFTGVTSVTFGGVVAGFTVLPISTISGCTGNHMVQAIAPPSASSSGGPVSVVVSNAYGSASNQPTYTYTAQPIILNISRTNAPSGCHGNNDPPNSPLQPLVSSNCWDPLGIGPHGSASGDQSLTLTGYNFNNATNVAFCIFLPGVPPSGNPYSGLSPIAGSLAANGGTMSSSQFNQLFSGGNNSCGIVTASFQVVSDSEITLHTPSDWFLCPAGDFITDVEFCTGLDIAWSTANNYAAIVVTTQNASGSSGNNGTTTYISPAGGANACPGNSYQIENASGQFGNPPTATNPSIGNGITCFYHFGEPPVISGVNNPNTNTQPPGGPVSGGNQVDICGKSGISSAGVTGVSFGYSYNGSIIPESTNGTQNWSIQSWTYNPLNPTNFGPCGFILGTGGDAECVADALAFQPCYNYILVNSAPASPCGACTVNVRAWNDFGQSNPKSYSYGYPPQITSIYPTDVPPGGGTITIYGNYLGSVNSVYFHIPGASPTCAAGTNISGQSNTQLTVNVPAVSHTVLGICTSTWALPPPGNQQATVTAWNSAGSGSYNYLTYDTPTYTDNACDAAGNPLGWCDTYTDAAADGTGIDNSDVVDPYTWTDHACDLAGNPGGHGCGSEPYDGDGVEPSPNYTDNACDAAGNPAGWCYTDTDALADATSTGNSDAYDPFNWSDNACDLAGNPGGHGCSGEPDGDETAEPSPVYSDNACDAAGNPGGWCYTDTDALADATNTGNSDTYDPVNWTDNACDAAGNPGGHGCVGGLNDGDENTSWVDNINGSDGQEWCEGSWWCHGGDPDGDGGWKTQENSGINWDDNACDAAGNPLNWSCDTNTDAAADGSGIDNSDVVDSYTWTDHACDLAGNPGGHGCGSEPYDGDGVEPSPTYSDNACDAAGNPLGWCDTDTDAAADGSGIGNSDVVDSYTWSDNACDLAGNPGGHGCSGEPDGDETAEPSLVYSDNACDAAGNPLGWCDTDTDAVADAANTGNSDAYEPPVNWSDNACDLAGNPGGHGCSGEPDGN